MMKKIISVLLILWIAPVGAHPLSDSLSGWATGILHPIHGWDHILGMLAIGIWVAQQQGILRGLIPISFIAILSIGLTVGVGSTSLAWTELGVLASIAVMGVLIYRYTRLDSGIALGLIGVFALCHGYAHGAQLPVPFITPDFVAGFISTSTLLLIAGMQLGRLASLPYRNVGRTMGTMLLGSSLWFLLGS